MSETVVSIVTPTRRTDWLFETLRSLGNQSVTRWRWLIGESDEPVPHAVRRHPGVQVLPLPKDDAVSGWRQSLIDQADGEFLLELDPEDQLRPNALAELIEAGRDGLAFGDVSMLGPDGFETLDERHGWTHRVEVIEGMGNAGCRDVRPLSAVDV